LMLADVGGTELAAIVDGGLLKVTTREKADTIQVVVVYDVSEITSRDAPEDVIEMLQSVTAGPWHNMDGEGGTLAFPRPETLVVRQTEKGLREVDRLLQVHLQAARSRPPGPRRAATGPETVEVRRYRMPESMATDLVRTIPRMVATNSWKALPDGSEAIIEKVSLAKEEDSTLQSLIHDLERTRERRVNKSGGGGFFQVASPPAKFVVAPDEIQSRLLQQLLDYERRENQEREAILVIRQTRRVQGEVVKFLEDLLATQTFKGRSQSPITSGGFGGGGGSGGGGAFGGNPDGAGGAGKP
jgi:hypothetical protein